MVHARVGVAAAHPECEEKGLCGYDSRLSFNEEEFAHWLTTAEGKSAFETGVLGPRTEETKGIGERIYAPDQVVPRENVVIDALSGICLSKAKSCARHRKWREIHGQDFVAMQSLLKRELERLGGLASEIIEDAEGREATKEYHAHNTVEVLF